MDIGRNGGGTKRSQPDSVEQGGAPPAIRRRLDPPGIHAKLIASFKQPPLEGTPLAALLSDLSLGRLREHPVAEETLIEELLIQQEFAAFVETFNLFNDLQETRARHEGKPFKRVLDLRVPSDWVLTDENGLANAMRDLRVTRVEVGKPYDELQQQKSPGTTNAILGALLLAGNMTELVVNCALTKTDALRYALSNSRLASIELMVEVTGGWTLRPEEKKTAALLLDGLRSCSTLKHVGLGHWNLAVLHPGIEQWAKNTPGPRLESIDLWSRCGLPARHRKQPIDFEQVHLQFDAFMTQISRIKTLQDITVNVAHVGVRDLEAQIFEPLKHHPSLRKLTVNAPSNCLETRIENLEAMLRVLRLAVTCPSMRHFAWRTGSDDEESAEVTIREYVELVRSLNPELSTHEILAQVAVAEAIMALMASENFRLESLVFNGVPFFTGTLNALSRVLITNRTLRILDLFSSLFPFEAVGNFLNALKQNTTVTHGRLPDDYAEYLVVGLEKPPVLYGFKTAKNNVDVEPVHDFTLTLGDEDDEGIDEFTRAEANAAFDPYRDLASTMFTTFYDRLAENRRWHEFGPMVHGFVSSAVDRNVAPDPDIARTIVHSLVQQNAWPTLVHLSEVNRATAAGRHQSAALRHELMKQVREDRAAADHFSNPALAPSEESSFDPVLANAAYYAALKHEKFDAVRAELRRGATDSDGSFANDSYSASIREALRIAKKTATPRVEVAREAEGDTDAASQDL